MNLSKAQVVEIQTILENRGIKYEDVRLEMVDHLASEIEEMMEQGFTFHTALAKIKSVYTGQFLSDFMKKKEKEVYKTWMRILNRLTIQYYKPPVLFAMISVSGILFCIMNYHPLLVKAVILSYFILYFIYIGFLIKRMVKNRSVTKKNLSVHIYNQLVVFGIILFTFPNSLISVVNEFGVEPSAWFSAVFSVLIVWIIIQNYVILNVIPQKMEDIYHVKVII